MSVFSQNEDDTWKLTIFKTGNIWVNLQHCLLSSLLNYSHLFLVFRVFQTNSCLNSISSRTVSRWSKVFGYFLSSEIFFIIARNVEIFSHFYGSLNLKTFLDSLSLQLKKEHLVLILKLLSRSFCWCKPLKERFR